MLGLDQPYIIRRYADVSIICHIGEVAPSYGVEVVSSTLNSTQNAAEVDKSQEKREQAINHLRTLLRQKITAANGYGVLTLLSYGHVVIWFDDFVRTR